VSGRATFRFDSSKAARRAERELRAAGFMTEPDPNRGSSGFAVEFDADDADTDVPVGRSVELGSEFDRLERLVTGLGGELETWQVLRLTGIVRLDSARDRPE
jgi:hypothetical protein